MENLQYLRICHDISENFTSEPESLKISSFVKVPDIEEESIFAIIQLNHLHKASFSEIALKVNSQYLTVQNMRSTKHQRLEIVDIIRLFFFQVFNIFSIN